MLSVMCDNIGKESILTAACANALHQQSVAQPKRPKEYKQPTVNFTLF